VSGLVETRDLVIRDLFEALASEHALRTGHDVRVQFGATSTFGCGTCEPLERIGKQLAGMRSHAFRELFASRRSSEERPDGLPPLDRPDGVLLSARLSTPGARDDRHFVGCAIYRVPVVFFVDYRGSGYILTEIRLDRSGDLLLRKNGARIGRTECEAGSFLGDRLRGTRGLVVAPPDIVAQLDGGLLRKLEDPALALTYVYGTETVPYEPPKDIEAGNSAAELIALGFIPIAALEADFGYRPVFMKRNERAPFRNVAFVMADGSTKQW
jgi:hypothetical protein